MLDEFDKLIPKGEVGVDKKSGSKPESGQAAELLGTWRVAERDTAAAKAAVSIAALALAAAHAAEEAAVETEAAAKAAAEAAKAASEAVDRAMLAAGSAKKAAAAAAEAAKLATAVAEGDKARATQEVEVAEGSEEEAHAQFREAEERGFSKQGK